ncbi:MAG: HNH endonuclease [Frankiaceae bacterium]
MSRCQCVRQHSPSAYVPNVHHAIPQSWGGQTTPDNLVVLCPNSHTATHRLIDAYVRAGGDPGPVVRRGYNRLVRDLAARAWAGRPAHPTPTSLGHP